MFTPSLMVMRDDEMANLNSAVFFRAPKWDDPDMFAMHMFANILGEYRADRNGHAHLNSAER